MFSLSKNLQNVNIGKYTSDSSEKIKKEDKILIAMGIVILGAGLVFFVLITFIGKGSLYECCWLGGIMVLLGSILIGQGFKQNKDKKNVK